MKRSILLALIVFQLFLAPEIAGQTTVHIMRPKQYMGSATRMKIYVDGVLVSKIKSGHRLILECSETDRIEIQVKGAMLKGGCSIPTAGCDEAYLQLSYFAGYDVDPVTGKLSTLKNRLQVERLSQAAGISRFRNDAIYKDRQHTVKKIAISGVALRQQE